MNRRSFFKAVTGFIVGIFAGSTETKSICVMKSGPTGPTDIPSMSAEEWVEAQFNPVKELQFGQPFTGKIVSMTTFQGNLWIATEEGVYRIKERL
jgi:ligand-binding sensor domain-containing protein